MRSGAQSVMTAGVWLMQEWSADSWAISAPQHKVISLHNLKILFLFIRGLKQLRVIIKCTHAHIKVLIGNKYCMMNIISNRNCTQNPCGS